MGEPNLGDAISQLKVFKWQYDATKELEPDAAKEVREELIRNILETIEKLEVPQLVQNFYEY